MRDLKEIVSLIREAHPTLPIHALGESMGAAVILSAISKKKGMKRPPPGRPPKGFKNQPKKEPPWTPPNGPPEIYPKIGRKRGSKIGG